MTDVSARTTRWGLSYHREHAHSVRSVTRVLSSKKVGASVRFVSFGRCLVGDVPVFSSQKFIVDSQIQRQSASRGQSKLGWEDTLDKGRMHGRDERGGGTTNRHTATLQRETH